MLASSLLPLGRPCLALRLAPASLRLAPASLRLAPASLRLLSSGSARPASELAQLRKKTGYSLSICKKALGETDNDVSGAETWLQEQAQALGLAKASKLQGRNTSQGLMGVKVEGQVAAMVELNCETDFVARNQKFVALLEDISDACLSSCALLARTADGAVLTKDAVGALPADEGGARTLSDLLALNIGQIGENLALGGARVIRAEDGARVCGLCHPAGATTSGLLSGRYAALLLYRPLGAAEGSDEVARGVCQHIIGLAPTVLSDAEDHENSLVHQTYLLDEELKVGELLQRAEIEVLDFVRAEVGRGD